MADFVVGKMITLLKASSEDVRLSALTYSKVSIVLI